ncbi:MAG: hypothetical protein M3077_00300 [Candidatus Dormibacteraeota bacterium]|nr:hypothetical protein [Candidatus Dormibacteraeota bacterium]
MASSQVPAEREQAEPNQEAGRSQQDPTARTGESPVSGQKVPTSDREPGKVPAASETWVEGQATSDADYQEPDKER